jgi:hypothetical protein
MKSVLNFFHRRPKPQIASMDNTISGNPFADWAGKYVVATKAISNSIMVIHAGARLRVDGVQDDLLALTTKPVGGVALRVFSRDFVAFKKVHD